MVSTSGIVRLNARGRIFDKPVIRLEWAEKRFQLYRAGYYEGSSGDEEFFFMLDHKTRRYSIPKHIYTATVWSLRGILLDNRLLIMCRDSSFEIADDRVMIHGGEGHYGIEDMTAFALDGKGLTPVTSDGLSWMAAVQSRMQSAETPADPEVEFRRLSVGAPLPPVRFQLEKVWEKDSALLVRFAGSSVRGKSIIVTTWRVSGGRAEHVKTKSR